MSILKLRKILAAILTVLFIPLGLVMNALGMLLLVGVELAGRLTSTPKQECTEITRLEASIVVPSWNGKELLQSCIPSLEKAIGLCEGEHEIIVVDNGSSDGSKEYLMTNFPGVKIIQSPTNLGFSGAANLGIKSCSKDIVVLLNNDMVVDQGFLAPLLNEFKGKPDLFAVTSQIFFWDQDRPREETGKTGARLRNGSIYPWHDRIFDDKQTSPVTYAGGGSSAYDRKKLLELGCFDELYSPFYVEDVDLSFMAWKRGWRVLFKPESVVYHKHRGTIGSRFSPAYVESILRRNQILFVWKNIDGAKPLVEHFLWLWVRLLARTLSGSFEYTTAYFGSFAALGSALKSRFNEVRNSKISSREVFLRSTSLSSYRQAFEPLKEIDRKKALRVLFACPYIPYPPSHGGAVRMYNLIKQLARTHEIYLLSFVENESELVNHAHLSEFCRDVRLILRQESWRRDKVLWLQPQSSLNEFYSIEYEAALQDMVDKYDIDIVQYEYTQMAQYIRNFPRAKNVLTEHDVTFVTRYRYFRALPWSKEKFKAFIRWAAMYPYELDICKKFDLVCSVSTKEKELLQRYDPTLRVSDAAPTGADTSYYQPGDRNKVEPASILFVGFFKHFPNVEGILDFCSEVYPLVQEQVPEVQLYVVGANPPEAVRALAADQSVIVTGFVADLREYYSRSTLFVVPIKRGAGTRVKIFEAMAAGIPIVSTTLGAEGITVTNFHDILLADDPKIFASHVVSLLRNPTMGEAIAKEARELVVNRYEWANIAQRLAGEYYTLWGR
jgi:O-antigen biosynthesis protein